MHTQLLSCLVLLFYLLLENKERTSKVRALIFLAYSTWRRESKSAITVHQFTDMAKAQETLDKLTASHKAFKGHLTRNINSAVKTLDQARQVGPSTVMRDALVEAERKVKDSYSKVEDSICKIQELATDDFDDLEEKMLEDTDKFDKIMDKLRDMRIKFEPQLQAPGAAAAAGGQERPSLSQWTL